MRPKRWLINIDGLEDNILRELIIIELGARRGQLLARFLLLNTNILTDSIYIPLGVADNKILNPNTSVQ